MEEKATMIESLIEKVENYFKSNIELLKLNAIKQSATLASTLISKQIFGFAFVIILLMLNVGTALWIGSCLGQLYYGFFIVAAFDILLFLLLFAFRKSIIETPIINAIVEKMDKES